MVLASVLARLGDLTEAARLERLVEGTRAVVLGDQHPDTLRCRANRLLTEGEANGGGPTSRKDVVTALSLLLGADHPDVRTADREDRLLCMIDPQPF